MGKYNTHALALELALRAVPMLRVLELGQGRYSTPLLMQRCQERGLVSVENNPKYYRPSAGAWMQTRLVREWEEMWPWVLACGSYGVALVDHAPALRRAVDLARLRDHVWLMVVHDTESAEYGYAGIREQWRWRWDDRGRRPWTGLWTNREGVAAAVGLAAIASGLALTREQGQG